MELEMPFGLKDIKPFGFNSSPDVKVLVEENPVSGGNNYLKTPEEIDAELSREMNMRNDVFAEQKIILDSYGRIFKNRSDNAYSSDNNPSGFMEENY